MRLAITGGGGLVGAFAVLEAQAAGDTLRLLSRPAYRLGDAPDLSGCDALLHCAFQHVPGRYRGGEGDDPAGFIRANLDGSVRLFQAAKAAGVGRVVFLSSRAVYGDYPPGTVLTEDLPPRPDTLYGQVKWQAEQALAGLDAPGFRTATIRATGVYGPGAGHKWVALFHDYLAGRAIAPRCGTEILGSDLAAAIRLLLVDHGARGVFNASDLLLDRHDLLGQVARLTGCPHPPPRPSDAPVSAMRCDRLAALGWQPSGRAGLARALPQMLRGI